MPPSLIDIARVAVRASWSRARGPVGILHHRVRPSYVDVNLHMNYASYLQVMELARWDWGLRSGMFRTWLKSGFQPVVGSLTIEYRRELRPLQAFTVHTRLIGFDRRAMVVEQVFRVGDVEHARSTLNIVLRNRAGGGVATRDQLEALTAGFVTAP